MTLPFVRPGAGARWPLWLCAALWSVCAQAQTPPASPAEPQAAAETATSAADDAPAPARFDVQIEADGDLRAFLLRHLELMRYRTLADLEAPELERLLARTPDNLLDLLGTLGHFAPRLDVQGPQPEGPTPLGTVRIRVEPGPQTRVASAEVYFRGDIADNPDAAALRERVRSALTVQPGQPFTQADWSSAKTATLRALTARRYPAGRLYNSLADVDTADHSVRLALEFDSGPPIRLGPVRIEGTQRYDPAVVERLLRLSGVTAGSDYDLARLQEAQQRLADTGYFESAHVSVEPGDDPGNTPVRVQVREAFRQKLVLGVGGSTDSGARLSIEHSHQRVPGIDWRASTKLQLEREDQQISTDWSAPVDAQGWRWITSGLLARQIDGNNTTTSQRLRLGQAQNSEALDRSFFLQLDRAQSVNALIKSLGTGVTEASLTANYAWTRRRFDSTPFPQRGYGLGVEAGVGYTLVGERRPFGRTVGRWLGYWPLGETLAATTTPLGTARADAPQGSRWGRLALRLEGGAVWARGDTPVPETQLFLTGGDTSVRGYGLRNIGVAQADGGVAPGRYMTVGSLEWQQPVWRNGQRTPWETALFIDGGSVAQQVGDLKARWGVGGGVRYNSPVGPLRLDLAYGVQPRAWRVHFNVGFTF